MADSADRERILRLELEQDSAQRRDEEMIAQMRLMQSELKEIRDLLTQAKGGWRLVVGVGSGVALLYGTAMAAAKMWETLQHLRTPLGK